MLPKQQQKSPLKDMFKIDLRDLINMDHSLVSLSNLIDWQEIDTICSEFFNGKGRSALPSRLAVGLLLLKQLDGLSDEEVCKKYVENPYYQYFCGNQYFTHELPLDSSSLTIWRNRIGSNTLEKVLGMTIAIGLEKKIVSKKDLGEVIVDTTVQEKAITFPTDSKLLQKSISNITKLGKDLGICYRQSYIRTAKRLCTTAMRAAHSRKFNLMKSCNSKLKIRLGRVIRESQRNLEELILTSKLPELKHFKLQEQLNLGIRLLQQNVKSENKLYSLHEAEVSCIAKGKVHKKYEFGSKVGIVSTIKNNFIVGVKSFTGNPYDGKTLAPLVQITEHKTNVAIKTILVDKGFRGVKRQFPDKVIMMSGQKNLTQAQRDKLDKRSKIEPLIGIMKSKCGLGYNRLKGISGDKINLLLSAIASNLRIILKIIFLLILSKIFYLKFRQI